MAIAYSAILMVESGSIHATMKAREMTVAMMLAKNALVQTEMEMDNLAFKELKEKETFDFSKPYEEYQWTRIIKKIELPNLTGAMSNPENEKSSTSQEADVFAKLFSEYLSKAIREVKIVVSWNKGKGKQKYSVSTYWVDLNSEFKWSQ